MSTTARQNVTVRLSTETIRKARILAAQRSTSISGLIADQVEALIGVEESYQNAQAAALALMERGFHMGGAIAAARDELHER
jgi:predicted transcriptional regulator